MKETFLFNYRLWITTNVRCCIFPWDESISPITCMTETNILILHWFTWIMKWNEHMLIIYLQSTDFGLYLTNSIKINIVPAKKKYSGPAFSLGKKIRFQRCHRLWQSLRLMQIKNKYKMNTNLKKTKTMIYHMGFLGGWLTYLSIYGHFFYAAGSYSKYKCLSL